MADTRPHVYSMDCWCSPEFDPDANGGLGRYHHHGVTEATEWLFERDAIALGQAS